MPRNASVVHFRPARWGDCRAIASRIRDIDALECRAHGREPLQALRLGLRASGSMCWTGLVDGRPAAMFGVVPVSLLSGRGTPWLLGTDDVRRAARHWFTDARVFLAMIEANYPILENEVHASNRAAIRLLERLGFKVDADVVMVGGEPFRRFSWGL